MSDKIQHKNIDNKEGTMSTPNIFSYATKELSQDAFICWLVACATEATGNLRECGLEFVRALFQAGALDGTEGVPVLGPDGELIAPHDGPCDVSDVCKPRLQHQKIDVYFYAKVDGKKVSFLIEDKVDTEAHGDQLPEYLNAVIQDEHKGDLIKPIYFKTGYMFNNERDDVEKNKYSVFKAEDLKKFLDSHPKAVRESEILHQYAEYLNDKMEARDTAQKNWGLKQDYVLWEFLRKLRGVLRKADDEWQCFLPCELSGEPDSEEPDEWRWKGLGRGNNLNSKSPWTQYWFSKHLYWRLDRKPWLVNPNLRVQLRLMISLANAGMNYDQNYDEIQEYRSLFVQVLGQEDLRTGNVRKVKAKNECTVGSVNIVNKTTKFQGLTEDEFLDHVKRVHIEFLKSYQQIYKQYR